VLKIKGDFLWRHLHFHSFQSLTWCRRACFLLCFLWIFWRFFFRDVASEAGQRGGEGKRTDR